jgi:hypothetical protein
MRVVKDNFSSALRSSLRENLIQYSNMDTDSNADGVMDGFTIWRNGATVCDTSLDLTKKAQKLALTSAAATGAIVALGQNNILCNPGDIVSACVDAELAILTGAPSIGLSIKFLTVGGGLLQQYVATYITTSGQSTIKIENKTAPVNTHHVFLECIINVAALSDTCNAWFKNAMLEKAFTVGSYIETGKKTTINNTVYKL